MKPAIINFTEKEMEDNHRKYIERLNFYKNNGFDQEKVFLNIINQIDKKHETILEIGSGKGYLAAMLAQSFLQVTTIDTSKRDSYIAMLNTAYLKVMDRVNFIVKEENTPDFNDKNFDAVVSAFSFHHMKKPFKSIRQMIRIAKYQIIISDFNEYGFNIIDKISEIENKKHRREYGDFSIVGVFLKDFGFDVRIFEDKWQKIYIAERD